MDTVNYKQNSYANELERLFLIGVKLQANHGSITKIYPFPYLQTEPSAKK